MRIAVVGCCHGNLRAVYKAIDASGERPDLVLICGDFQAVRDAADLDSMAVPTKYRAMGDFSEFYPAGAPLLTLVIGGNHEASKHMLELPYGGWLAPNIYYFGYAGVVSFRGVTIGGLSGIWYKNDYWKDHFESFPFGKSALHSVYHIRQEDIRRLWLMGPGSIDIMLSHDWPAGIEHHGHLDLLLHKKGFLRKDIERGQLGSPPGMELLKHLQPPLWLSAHLHCHYEAEYRHSGPHAGEIDNDLKKTHFIALDKVLPKREFLEFVTVPDRSTAGLELDGRWLWVLRSSLSGSLKQDTVVGDLEPFPIPAFGPSQTSEFCSLLGASATHSL